MELERSSDAVAKTQNSDTIQLSTASVSNRDRSATLRGNLPWNGYKRGLLRAELAGISNALIATLWTRSSRPHLAID